MVLFEALLPFMACSAAFASPIKTPPVTHDKPGFGKLDIECLRIRLSGAPIPLPSECSHLPGSSVPNPYPAGVLKWGSAPLDAAKFRAGCLRLLSMNSTIIIPGCFGLSTKAPVTPPMYNLDPELRDWDDIPPSDLPGHFQGCFPEFKMEAIPIVRMPSCDDIEKTYYDDLAEQSAKEIAEQYGTHLPNKRSIPVPLEKSTTSDPPPTGTQMSSRAPLDAAKLTASCGPPSECSQLPTKADVAPPENSMTPEFSYIPPSNLPWHYQECFPQLKSEAIPIVRMPYCDYVEKTYYDDLAERYGKEIAEQHDTHLPENRTVPVALPKYEQTSTSDYECLRDAELPMVLRTECRHLYALPFPPGERTPDNPLSSHHDSVINFMEKHSECFAGLNAHAPTSPPLWCDDVVKELHELEQATTTKPSPPGERTLGGYPLNDSKSEQAVPVSDLPMHYPSCFIPASGPTPIYRLSVCDDIVAKYSAFQREHGLRPVPPETRTTPDTSGGDGKILQATMADHLSSESKPWEILMDEFEKADPECYAEIHGYKAWSGGVLLPRCEHVAAKYSPDNPENIRISQVRRSARGEMQALADSTASEPKKLQRQKSNNTARKEPSQQHRKPNVTDHRKRSLEQHSKNDPHAMNNRTHVKRTASGLFDSRIDFDETSVGPFPLRSMHIQIPPKIAKKTLASWKLDKREQRKGIGYFEQPLDHSNPSGETFMQRYYWDKTYWNRRGDPVVLLSYGEKAVDDTTLGFANLGMLGGRIAQQINASVIILEHRFWGESVPAMVQKYGLTAETLQHLTLENSMLDHINFAQRVSLPWDESPENNAPGAPWILTGGSYGGALTAWIEDLYPNTFWAYHASSAPVQAIDNYWQYWAVIQHRSMAQCPVCVEHVQRSLVQIDKILTYGDVQAQAYLKAAFGLADVQYNDDFVNALTMPLFSMQYGPDPFLRYFMTSGPYYNPYFDGLELPYGSRDSLSRFAAYVNQTKFCSVTNEWEQANPGHCLNSYNLTNAMYTDRSVGSPQNLQWRWMLCNEPFGWWQASPESDPSFVPWSGHSVISSLLTPQYFSRQCDIFFPTVNGYTFGRNRYEPVSKQRTVADTNAHTGGWNRQQAKRLIWVNGEFDPWRRAGVASQENPWGPRRSSGHDEVVFDIAAGYHCDDFIYPMESDTDLYPDASEMVRFEDRRRVIDGIVKQMKEWIDEYHEIYPRRRRHRH